MTHPPEMLQRLSSSEQTAAAVLAKLEDSELPRRIWQRDHTVWKPDPTEIADRLGWLTVASEMRSRVPELRAFADEVRAAGYEHLVLLGMGGSSLGALAIQKLFGSADGYPELIVLDTTIPETIRSISETIDCAKTLFIVASKSGSTIEPNMLYEHFRELVRQSVGGARAGLNFIAICDRATPLESVAYNQLFRRVFTNPPDIGGRYSVQSLFGLVPAALIGVDIGSLLDRVIEMSHACGAQVPASRNPAASLGAAMGALAGKGIDKLTLTTTSSLDGFALWVEQLIAESLGKEGRGIVPIAGEPICRPADLSADRIFVYARLASDDTTETDAHIAAVESAGIPTIRLNLADRYDIGAEFFRWEFATAVAASVMGVHPFDQPNVQQAKDFTSDLLAAYGKTGVAPAIEPVGSFSDLMESAAPGDYLAITAYAHPSPDIEAAIARLRERVARRWRIATTFGYGPRYLHSTGQLHKGGAASGIFLQLAQIDDGGSPVMLAGQWLTFGALAAAQAKGDFDALAAQSRPVARLNLAVDAAATLDALARG